MTLVLDVSRGGRGKEGLLRRTEMTAGSKRPPTKCCGDAQARASRRLALAER